MPEKNKAFCLQCGGLMVEAVQLMVVEGQRQKPAYYSCVHCSACKISKEFFEVPRSASLNKFGMRLPGIGVIKKGPSAS